MFQFGWQSCLAVRDPGSSTLLSRKAATRKSAKRAFGLRGGSHGGCGRPPTTRLAAVDSVLRWTAPGNAEARQHAVSWIFSASLSAACRSSSNPSKPNEDRSTWLSKSANAGTSGTPWSKLIALSTSSTAQVLLLPWTSNPEQLLKEIALPGTATPKHLIPEPESRHRRS